MGFDNVVAHPQPGIVQDGTFRQGEVKYHLQRIAIVAEGHASGRKGQVKSAFHVDSFGTDG